MRTVTFQSVLYGVARRLGLDPARNFPADTAQTLTDYLQQRIREGWEAYPWPELCVIEGRSFRPEYAPDVIYEVNDEVFDPVSHTYFRSLDDANEAHPLSDDAFWAPCGKDGQPDIQRYIASREPGSLPVIELLEAWKCDPRQHSNPAAMPYWFSERGIEFGPSAPNVVWIRYRLQPPRFTAEVFDETAVYQPGDLRYFSTDCYECLATTLAGQSPATAPGKWRIQPVPFILSEFARRAVIADALREDGQFDKAASEEAHAQTALESQMIIPGVQMGDRAGFSVSLRV